MVAAAKVGQHGRGLLNGGGVAHAHDEQLGHENLEMIGQVDRGAGGERVIAPDEQPPVLEAERRR